MNLNEQRSIIRHLLDEDNPADAVAAYYAFYYSDNKTQLISFPKQSDPQGRIERASGYIALSLTGIDLFRPLVTLRLPPGDLEASVELIYGALPEGTAVILHTPQIYMPLLQALFDIHTEQHIRLLVLNPSRFEPIINVLVTQETAANGLPRFVLRSTEKGQREIMASASLNWQSPRYAEIAVSTNLDHRRQGFGRSVVGAMVNELLANGRLPLYAVAQENEASFQLATRLGFGDKGIRELLLQATLRPRP